MTKVSIGLFSMLMWVCCAHFAESGCAAQDLPSSPRIAALQKLLEAGDRGALESFWQRIGQEGAPIIEIAPGEARHRYFRDVLRAKGYEVHYEEFNAGHSYYAAHSLSNGLLTLLRNMRGGS